MVLMYLPSSNSETTSRFSFTLVKNVQIDMNGFLTLCQILCSLAYFLRVGVSTFQSHRGNCRCDVHTHHHTEEYACTLKTFIKSFLYYNIIIFHRGKTVIKPKINNHKNKQKKPSNVNFYAFWHTVGF